VVVDAFGEIPPADDALVRRLCEVGTLTVPFRWRSVGTEIGAAELIAKYGRECVAAALACVLEKKRIEGKRDGATYRPSPGYLLAALRGDWAGWNLPAAVAARAASARKAGEVAERKAAAARVLADAAAAARSAESAEQAARAAVVEWLGRTAPDVVRDVVSGVLASVSGLVRGSVLAAARKAAPDEGGQAAAAAVHRLIVEQVAAASAARVGRRVEPVGV
jgi:hypothetical protein